MKKLFVFAFVAVVAGAIGTASAIDRSGKLGLGAQEVFSSGGNTGFAGTSAGSWSLKYGVSSNVNAQFTVGFDIINKGGNNQANFGARLLYDLVENENSDFYTGVGIGYNLDKNNKVLRVSLPLGFEWSFASLPEIGISFEAGIVWDYRTDAPKASRFSSVGGNVGGNAGVGFHYYF